MGTGPMCRALATAPQAGAGAGYMCGFHCVKNYDSQKGVTVLDALFSGQIITVRQAGLVDDCHSVAVIHSAVGELNVSPRPAAFTDSFEVWIFSRQVIGQ